MFGFSMVKMVRKHAAKLDAPLKQNLVELYRPFKWVPCIFHRPLENFYKRFKRYPVIIQFHENQHDILFTDHVQTLKTLTKNTSSIKIKHEFPSISGCSAKVTPNALEKILEAHPSIKHVSIDREVKALLDVATPAINSSQLQTNGITGKNVTISIIDTGIYPHNDLTRPYNRIVGFKDFVNNRSEPYDDNGHGTHCAGDAAGNGYSSSGEYKAPASDANLVGVKVLNKMGSGSLSTVIAGIEWCISNKDKYGINVISMSLGAEATQQPENDPVVQAVEAAWDKGIVVVVAAGNSGPEENTIASPGISPKVITVGAVDDHNTLERSDETIADFSSRGPTISGLMKPDIVSPGVDIVSLRSPSSYLDKLSKSSRVGDYYFSLSGTSMATPICAGVVAQLLDAHPNWSPAQIKEALTETADDVDVPETAQGNGYVNAQEAVNYQFQ